MQHIESRQWGRSLQVKGHELVGTLLATIGFFWLAHKAGWIPVSEGGSVIFWPLVTIGLGLIILFGSRQGQARNIQ